MARGTYYSDIENERLLKLWEHNSEKNYAEVAEMAVQYGICEGRSVRGVAQQISKLVTPQEAPVVEPEQMEFDTTSLILEKENRELRQELTSLLNTIFDTATLYQGYALHLDYRAILTWLHKNEPGRVSAQIEALRLEAGLA